MATEKADPDSDGAALFSMDDLRARLDAPLYDRVQGLATPPKLPRLRELSFEHAEVPLPLPVSDVHAVDVPVDVVEVVPVEVVPVEVAVVPSPARKLPKLASFSELMASTRVAEPVVVPEPVVVAEPVVVPEPVVAEPVVAALVPEPAVSPAIMTLPVAEPNFTPTHGQRSSIEAELNRLAFLPDQAEQVGRVEIPAIAIAHPQPRAMGVPVLSQHEMYNPRATAAMPTVPRVALKAAFEGTAPRRRSKKGLVGHSFVG